MHIHLQTSQKVAKSFALAVSAADVTVSVLYEQKNE